MSTVLGGIKSAVTSAFSNILSGIKGKMSSIFDAVKGGFEKAKNHITGLASEAITWGKDLVMGLVNGINSCIGKVGDAVKSVADKIKGFLHFSVPDEGPLTDYETWMPDFMRGLAKGIDKSKSVVAKAVEGVSQDMVISPNVNATSAAMESTSTSSAQNTASIVGAIHDAIAGLNMQGGNISIPVYIGGTLLDEVVVNAQQRINLRSGGR